MRILIILFFFYTGVANAQMSFGTASYDSLTSVIDRFITDNDDSAYSIFEVEKDTIAYHSYQFLRQQYTWVNRMFEGGCCSKAECDEMEKYIIWLHAKVENINHTLDSISMVNQQTKLGYATNQVGFYITELQAKYHLDLILDDKIISYAAPDVIDLTDEIKMHLTDNKALIIHNFTLVDTKQLLASLTYEINQLPDYTTYRKKKNEPNPKPYDR